MFFHMFRYSLKMLVRNRDILFWSLVFPFVVGTLLYLLLARSFDVEEKFHTIPTAVVLQSEGEGYIRLLQGAETAQGMPLLEITETTGEQAEDLLKRQKVKGIIYIGDSLALKVLESGREQSLLHLIVNRAQRCMDLSLPWQGGEMFVEEKGITGDDMNCTMNFMYAVIALSCLLSALMGCDRMAKRRVCEYGAGIRLYVAPLPEVKGFLADFLVSAITGYAVVCLLFLYMRFLLGIPMGNRYLLIFLALMAAVGCGVMLGMFVGSLPIRRENDRLTVLTGSLLVCCALDDLMIEGIRDSVEHTIPLVNDINPAALISDALYSLNLYGTGSRFWADIGKLGGETVLLALLCLVIGRRRRHAGL